MADEYIASEGARRLESRSIRAGQSVDDLATRIPVGECHAVTPGATSSVCGVALDELEAFEDERWTRVGLERCPECLAAVPIG